MRKAIGTARSVGVPLFTVLLALFALCSCSDKASDVAAGRVPDLRAAARVAAGRALYAVHCASCHGVNLEGQPDWRQRRAGIAGKAGRLPAPPHDDSGHTWHHGNDVLFALVQRGLVPPNAPAGYESDMPAFGQVLTDDQIWSVLAYIESRWSEEVRQRRDQLEQQLRTQRPH